MRVTLALYRNNPDAATQYVLLAKPTVKRRKDGVHHNPSPYKTWMTAKEIAALIPLLQRALTLMDEHHEGTLNMEHILSEDEEASRFIMVEGYKPPTLENIFELPNDPESGSNKKP